MSDTALIVGVCLLIGVAFGFGPVLLRRLRDRREIREARREAAEWAAANPPGPPFTPTEEQAFGDWVAASHLSAALLTPIDIPVAAGGNRIGGPAWLPPGAAWPRDRAGNPMEFVAQLDFAALPPLPDFPQRGLLQFFVAQDDLFGADFDHPERGDIRLLWYPDGPAGGQLVPPPPVDPDTSMTPFLDQAARSEGVTLAGNPASMPPTGDDWRVLERLGLRADIDRLHDWLIEIGRPFAQAHHAGGHPVYTQWDFRSSGRFADYDRVLLRLTSEDFLMWGDCGEAAFHIRREDLLARRFDRAIFFWDCT